MANDDRTSEIFTLNGKSQRADVSVRTRAPDLLPRRAVLEPSYDSYAPYAAAWKEYDKLQKTAKAGRAPIVDLALALFGATGLFDPHKPTKSLSRVAFVIALIVVAVRWLHARYAKSLLSHWRCPRCHAEWPGEKLDKGPQCTVCGLKLHQMWA